VDGTVSLQLNLYVRQFPPLNIMFWRVNIILVYLYAVQVLSVPYCKLYF
jgi:hypothetical protein